MPTTVTVGSNYAGKAAGAIIGKAFKEADTLRLGLISIAENVNYKLNLRKIAYTDGTTAYSCGHTPAGAVTLSEKVLTPIKLKNDIQVCKEDFRATWSEDQLGSSAWNKDFIGSDISDAIAVEVLGETSEITEDKIWQGDNGLNSDEWDGFETLWAADGSIITPTGPSGIAALSEATVEQHLKVALAAIPRAIRKKSDVKVAVAADVFQYYWFNQISKGIANDGTAQPKEVRFGKYMLTEVNGLSDGKIAIFQKSNLIFATGLQGDHNMFKLVDEDEIGLLTGYVRGKMVYNGGVEYYNPAEIVYYDAVAVA